MEDPLGFLKAAWRPDLNIAELPEKVKEVTRPEVNLDFFFQLDEYIKAQSRKVTSGMVRSYNVVKQRLLAFQTYRKTKIKIRVQFKKRQDKTTF